ANMRVGGVILFDRYGKLASMTYGFRMTDAPSPVTGPPSPMALFLNPGGPNPVADLLVGVGAQPLVTFPVSSFGFVLYDLEMASGATAFTDEDPTYSGQATVTAGS